MLNIYPATKNDRAKARHILIAYEKAWQAATDMRRKRVDAQQLTEFVKQQFLSGQSFAFLARKYSEDPTANLGGDLNIIEPGDMTPEFEEALFSLQINEITVTETGYGFHLLQRLPLEEVQLTHILVTWDPPERNQESARSIAENAYADLNSGKEPALVAKQYSDGPYGSRGGMLGWFERTDLRQELADIAFELHVDTCSKPVKGDDGFHILCRMQ